MEHDVVTRRTRIRPYPDQGLTEPKGEFRNLMAEIVRRNFVR